MNDPTETGDTALHKACSLDTSSKTIIKLLIAHEANPNIYNHDKRTPLIIAFENHKIKPDSLELILDNSLKNDPQGESAKLALKNTIETYIASQQGPELKFSPVPAPDYDFSEPPRPIYRKTEYLEKVKDNILLLCRYLKDNLDINAEYSQGKTLLHIAAATQDQNFLDHLLKSYKEVIDVNKIDKLGQTALHIAAKNKNDNIEVVKLLLDQGINQSILDKHGHSALYYAEESENVNICNFLSPQMKSARNTGAKDIQEGSSSEEPLWQEAKSTWDSLNKQYGDTWPPEISAQYNARFVTQNNLEGKSTNKNIDEIGSKIKSSAENQIILSTEIAKLKHQIEIKDFNNAYQTIQNISEDSLAKQAPELLLEVQKRLFHEKDKYHTTDICRSLETQEFDKVKQILKIKADDNEKLLNTIAYNMCDGDYREKYGITKEVAQIVFGEARDQLELLGADVTDIIEAYNL